jgi:hypothetical protein
MMCNLQHRDLRIQYGTIPRLLSPSAVDQIIPIPREEDRVLVKNTPSGDSIASLQYSTMIFTAISRCVIFPTIKPQRHESEIIMTFLRHEEFCIARFIPGDFTAC